MSDILKDSDNKSTVTISLQKPSSLERRYADSLSECDRLITYFQKRARTGKRIVQPLRFLSVFLAILVTVLSAIQGLYYWLLPVVSGLASLCTTWLNTSNASEFWMRSRDTQQQLEAEKFLFSQNAGPYSKLDEEDKLRLFSERIVEMWSTGHMRWNQSLSSSGISVQKENEK